MKEEKERVHGDSKSGTGMASIGFRFPSARRSPGSVTWSIRPYILNMCSDEVYTDGPADKGKERWKLLCYLNINASIHLRITTSHFP